MEFVQEPDAETELGESRMDALPSENISVAAASSTSTVPVLTTVLRSMTL